MENKNLKPAVTEQPKKKRAPSTRAVRRIKKQDTDAASSASSPSPQTSAKGAKNTLPNPQRTLLARFIIDKFMRPEKIVWARDMALAYRLADRHPNLEFWKGIYAKRKIDSLVILWSVASRNNLTRQFQEYSTRLALRQKLSLDKPSKTFIIGEQRCGEDANIPVKRPRSIKEFYQKYGS